MSYVQMMVLKEKLRNYLIKKTLYCYLPALEILDVVIVQKTNKMGKNFLR